MYNVLSTLRSDTHRVPHIASQSGGYCYFLHFTEKELRVGEVSCLPQSSLVSDGTHLQQHPALNPVIYHHRRTYTKMLAVGLSAGKVTVD